jgi:hypothetical protein
LLLVQRNREKVRLRVARRSYAPCSASVRYALVVLEENPTAVHAVAEMHDTLNSVDVFAPVGFGVASTVHVFPFHFSATVKEALEVVFKKLEVPTAVHAVAEMHDTLISSGFVAPAGVGMGWIAQAVPFHRSATVKEALAGKLVLEVPTAVQAVAEVHDTLIS